MRFVMCFTTTRCGSWCHSDVNGTSITSCSKEEDQDVIAFCPCPILLFFYPYTTCSYSVKLPTNVNKKLPKLLLISVLEKLPADFSKKHLKQAPNLKNKDKPPKKTTQHSTQQPLTLNVTTELTAECLCRKLQHVPKRTLLIPPPFQQHPMGTAPCI